MLKKILRWVLRALYGFRAFNEPILDTKGPVLLLSNHLSWWDWLLIGVCLENDWKFVTSRVTAELSWVHNKIMVNRRTFPVDINSPYAVKHIAAYLQGGGRLVLFPEGRMSTTGSLMKLFEGTGFLLSRTRAKVITCYLRGAGRLPFSRNPNQKEWFPRLSIHFSALLNPPQVDHSTSIATRSLLTNWLTDVMIKQQFESEMEFGPATILEAIIAQASRAPRRHILQDTTLSKLTYGRLLTGAIVLASRWADLLEASPQQVGVLLPNTNAFPVVLLSLWLGKKVPSILNYTHGAATLSACARLAQLKQVITSRKFIERAQLDLSQLQTSGVQLVFLEDVRAGVTFSDRLAGIVGAHLRMNSWVASPAAQDPALVLFTSGSEGEPKGVELSHRNILGNIRQILSVIDLMDQDRFFNAMPLFHSFGLTIGLILPLVQGTFVFLYLSPLHYRVIPAALYNLNSSIFFGTNTFLAAYARKANAYDFRSIRYVFAGAEKLQESTTTEWMRKFGLRILEGYGATECSPCVSLNVPMRSRFGSAGRFLPGIEHRLEPVEGIQASEDRLPTGKVPGANESHEAIRTPGRLFVRGPNIMRGYLNREANQAFQALHGWYDTGDIARVDPDGYLFLLGRLKRFAKVSGEMVSLTAVEDALTGAFEQYGPRFKIAVVARPDSARGEKLVAVTNEPKLSLAQIRHRIQSCGLGNLAVPREIQTVRDLPLLGTGKINHRELEKALSAADAVPHSFSSAATSNSNH